MKARALTGDVGDPVIYGDGPNGSGGVFAKDQGDVADEVAAVDGGEVGADLDGEFDAAPVAAAAVAFVLAPVPARQLSVPLGCGRSDHLGC